MNSESLNPDTAPDNLSIWNSIDRTALERHTKALFDNKHIAGRHVYAEPSPSGANGSYPLPFEVERSLADDLAFVAAWQPQASSVSAAAIEQNGKNRSFVVKLAANEGISPNVSRKFDELFEVLREHARKIITRDDCQTKLFEIIVQLDYNKILGRLGASKFQAPFHLDTPPKALPEQLRHLFGRIIHSQNRLEFDRLDGQIASFQDAFRQLENETSDEIFPCVKRAIKQAYDITENGFDLPNRLRNLGYPDSLVDSKVIREVGKIANYWRISRHLAIRSQQFRSQFADTQWCPLPSYRASSKSLVMSRQYIHAEIQLLVHFELTSPCLVPRVIGASKHACFLCDSFIGAHGRFYITGAHRQTFPQWTVPDLEKYSLQTVQHFRHILSQLYEDVNREYLAAQEVLPWRPLPPQSAINSNTRTLDSPSTSTVMTMSGQVERCVTPQEQGRDGDSDGEATPPSSLLHRPHAHITDRQETLAERPIDVAHDEAVSEHRSWIYTFASFLDSPIVEPHTTQRLRFTGGSVSLDSSAGYEGQRMLRLADLPSNEEVVLERDSSDALHELSFVLVGSRERKVLVRCQWHMA